MPKAAVGLFNPEYALKLMGGNQDIVDDICRTIMKKFPEEIGKIESAIAKGDIDTVDMASHSLKSGAKSIEAVRLLDRLDQMRSACRQKDLDKVRRRFAALQSAVSDVVAAIRRYTAGDAESQA